jgi:hypothetical protein
MYGCFSAGGSEALTAQLFALDCMVPAEACGYIAQTLYFVCQYTVYRW